MTNNVSLLVAAFVILAIGMVTYNPDNNPTGRFFQNPSTQIQGLTGQGEKGNPFGPDASSALTFGDGDSDSGVLLSQAQSSSFIGNGNSDHAAIVEKLDIILLALIDIRADLDELKNGGNNDEKEEDKKDEDKGYVPRQPGLLDTKLVPDKPLCNNIDANEADWAFAVDSTFGEYCLKNGRCADPRQDCGYSGKDDDGNFKCGCTWKPGQVPSDEEKEKCPAVSAPDKTYIIVHEASSDYKGSLSALLPNLCAESAREAEADCQDNYMDYKPDFQEKNKDQCLKAGCELKPVPASYICRPATNEEINAYYGSLPKSKYTAAQNGCTHSRVQLPDGTVITTASVPYMQIVLFSEQICVL